jgi:hypothetical protein
MLPANYILQQLLLPSKKPFVCKFPSIWIDFSKTLAIMKQRNVTLIDRSITALLYTYKYITQQDLVTITTHIGVQLSNKAGEVVVFEVNRQNPLREI